MAGIEPLPVVVADASNHIATLGSLQKDMQYPEPRGKAANDLSSGAAGAANGDKARLGACDCKWPCCHHRGIARWRKPKIELL
jgi:hypothetical protein